jgi:hypothetical protein
MADKATLKLIQDDIQSIKSQIDILRMEAGALQLDGLNHILDLALREVEISVVDGPDSNGQGTRPLVLQ